MSITSDNLVADVDLLVTSDSGTFASSTSPMSFSVTTNNVTGYMLSISAKTGTDLTNSTAGTKFTSLSTADGIDSTTFNTTTYNNMWGFKPNYYKSTANTDKFYPSPTTSGVTLNKTDSANANADTYTIAIGARATYTQPAGTYSNTYILNAVGNYPKYSFTYIDSLTGNTISTDISAGASTTATLASAPSKDNYEFKGWCTVNNSSDPSQCKNASGTAGTTYAAGSSFSLSTLSANALNFYTIWERSLPDLAIQNLDATECTTTPTEVYDTRDNTAYTIQRLADGNCWLLDNLALDLTDANIQSKLNSSTTNATNTDIDYLLNGGGTASDQYATAGVSNNWNGSYSYSAPLIATSGDCADTDCANVPSDGKWTSAATVNWAVGIESIDGVTGGRIGAYYNYCAASAGTYCYGNGTSSGISSGDATADICPSGWRMPLGGSAGEYQSLYTAYDSDVIKFITAFHAALPGIYYNGYANIQNSDGYYWSSTRSSNDRMSGLNVTARASSFLPSNGLIRFGGLPVRCVMRDSSEYLQNATQESMAAKMPNVGDTATLYDIRDNNAYTVKNINGQYWMTQNLRFTGTELNSATSNIASAYTIDSPLNITYYDLSGVEASSESGQCYGSGLSGNGLSHACIKDPGDPATGVYYNYAAVTAMSVASDDDTTNATYDICPKGWHLPSAPSTTNGTDLNVLIGNTTSGWQDATTGLTLFSASATGVYMSGSLNSGYGVWWTSTSLGSVDRRYLIYNGASGQFSGNDTSYRRRYFGLSVRCVMKSPTIDTINYMQDINSSNKSSIMASMTTDQQYQLKDKRDDKSYYVAKLQDGNIWMTQNLDYSITADDVANGLTSETTNLVSYGSGVYTDGYSKSGDVITWKPARATIDATNVTNNSTSDWSNDNNAPYSVDPGDWYWIGNPFYASATCLYLNGCTDKFTKTMGTSTNNEHGHVGNYYNWSAAVASNNTGSLTASTYENPANNPQNSICPAGWRLPTVSNDPYSIIGSTDEFSRLNYLYNSESSSTSQNLEASPLYFVRAGYIGGGLEHSGYIAGYPSSTVKGGVYAYFHYSSSGYVDPEYRSFARTGGFPVRCVVR